MMEVRQNLYARIKLSLSEYSHFIFCMCACVHVQVFERGCGVYTMCGRDVWRPTAAESFLRHKLFYRQLPETEKRN